jgi:hypothetical protein
MQRRRGPASPSQMNIVLIILYQVLSIENCKC